MSGLPFSCSFNIQQEPILSQRKSCPENGQTVRDAKKRLTRWRISPEKQNSAALPPPQASSEKKLSWTGSQDTAPAHALFHSPAFGLQEALQVHEVHQQPLDVFTSETRGAGVNAEWLQSPHGPAAPNAARAPPPAGSHRFLLGESLRVSHFFSWWYILAALSNSLLRFP